MIFLVHGAVTIADRALRAARPGTARRGHARGRQCGRDLLRFELAASPAPTAARVRSRTRSCPYRLKRYRRASFILPRRQRRLPAGRLRLSAHHQGPGIRCLLDGGTASTRAAARPRTPGSAWYDERGGAGIRSSRRRPAGRFIRVMILRRALSAKARCNSSTPPTWPSPARQQYRIFADAPITRPKG